MRTKCGAGAPTREIYPGARRHQSITVQISSKVLFIRQQKAERPTIEGQPFAGIIDTEDAPSFRVLCERVGSTNLNLSAKSQECKPVITHPCRERKDGAPSIVVRGR